MSEILKRLSAWERAIRQRTDLVPRIGLVLGSGLGGLAQLMQVEEEIPYGELPGFPTSTVEGHAGKFLLGHIAEVPAAVMQGRVHYYEGYSMEEAVMPIRLLRMLGAEELLLTNAAGGICSSFHPGDLMLIRDQISLFVPNPLRGENPEELGPRFPDMSKIYDKGLCAAAKRAAERVGTPLKEGVYVQLSGPSYETPAEICLLRALGADAVGMSTACEAIAARHAGMRVCGISCITNLASGIQPQPLSHEEVQETADRVKREFETLVLEFVRKLDRPDGADCD